MFSTIFKYEIKYWLTQPITYIYILFFFGISFVTMFGMAYEAPEGDDGQILNAPYHLYRMSNLYSKLLLFLLPSIIGVSIYRDFKTQMHTVLYAYPFKKRDYLFAKFLSSLLIVVIIISMIGLGFIIGTQMPGVTVSCLVPFNILAYLQLYFVFLLPNVLLFGAIVFGVVSFSRNVYVGFVTVIVLIIVQALVGAILSGFDKQMLFAIWSPFGDGAMQYYTRYWTATDKNELMLPVGSLVVYNRLLWLGIAALVFGLVYKYFSFSQNAISFQFRKELEPRQIKNNFGSITKVKLPTVNFDFSFWQNLKTTWWLSGQDFRYIVKSWSFVAIVLVGFIFVYFQQSNMNPMYDFQELPLTWRMLEVPTFIYSGIINMLTFLYAGMLVHRSKPAKLRQLVDSTPIPNWCLLMSKFIAIVKMQMLLLSFIIIAGISVQIYKGFYNFEIAHYLFETYALNLIHYVLWAMLALFIHCLIGNLYIAFFFLLVLPATMISLEHLGPKIGLYFFEQAMFRYNQSPGQVLGFQYSDLDGYGHSLFQYVAYKTYWLMAGMILLVGARLFWSRGFTYSFKERFQVAKARFKTKTVLFTSLLLMLFLSLGFGIYYEDNIAYQKMNSKKEEKEWAADNEKRYRKYEYTMQPRITDVNIHMDIFPSTLDFKAKGSYILVNKSDEMIDTLLVNYSYDEETTYQFEEAMSLISRDTIIRFDIWKLEKPMAPGDSIHMSFEVVNQTNTLFRSNSNVLNNGTFIKNVFPKFGYRAIELRNNTEREKHGLEKRDNFMPSPHDHHSLGYDYSSNTTDWINFEATVSTSKDQYAFAPGSLQKEWEEDGRRYFKYKMEQKMDIGFSFHSGYYNLKKTYWNDVELRVYYQESHDYNIDGLLNGLKGSISYCTENFSPFPYKKIHIIEYPRSLGTFATVMGNLMPYSELYFGIDTRDSAYIDIPFYVSAHEMAHVWWGGYVNPANVRGGKMVTESLAEYVALKVLEREHGKSQMRKFLKNDLDLYLKGRADERQKEYPIIYTYPNQDYINYRKGALIFYALSDYIGEEKLNSALSNFEKEKKSQEAPFATSVELLSHVKKVIPDSLQYLITDMFETITLYENFVDEVVANELANGQFELTIDVVVSKYRSDEKGKRIYADDNGKGLSYEDEKSLPLKDYIEFGVFGENGEELYLNKHLFSRIDNQIKIIVDEQPLEVGIDPYNKLIDRNSDDNRKAIR